MARTRSLPLVAVAALFAGVALAETQLIPRIAVIQPATWDSKIVPRTSAGSLPTDNLVTAALLSPTAPVWLNWAVSRNLSGLGSWTDQLELDGVTHQLLPRRRLDINALSWFAMDAGPFYVRGGRHTVGAHADIDDHVNEDYTDLYDNEAYRQLLWTPEPLPATPGATFSQDAPPLPFPDGAAIANNHAYALAPSGQPWAVATSSGPDYDLTLFDDFTGSTSGLTHAVASSARTQDSLDVIVSGGSGLPAAVYPAVTRKPGAGEANYRVDWNDAAGHLDTDGDAFWSAESLNTGRFVNLYQVDLEAGVLYPLSLWTRVGLEPIHFAVFPAEATFLGSLGQALVRSQVVPGQEYEIATFTPAASGRYLILAFRDHNGGLQRYQLAVGSQAVSVIPGLDDPVRLSAVPNPSLTKALITYTLSEAARVRLDVLDLQGRLVDRLLDESRPAGTHTESWTLRNAAGEPVAPGLYWVRLDLGARRRLARLSVIR